MFSLLWIILLGAELPVCLMRFIFKALEEDAGRRYADGKAFAEALCRCGERAGRLKS